MGEARFDVPEADAFTSVYWEAAGRGELLVRRCGGCGRDHHYPREFCPYCWSEDVAWERASGRATLYTWSVVHRNDLLPFGSRTPYVAAVVDLAEGPRMMSEVVECEEGALRAGMGLEVTFREAGEDAGEGARRRSSCRCSGPGCEVRRRTRFHGAMAHVRARFLVNPFPELRGHGLRLCSWDPESE